MSTVIKQRVCVASQIFVDLRVNLSSQLIGQACAVQYKLNVVSRQQVITNFSAYRTLVQCDQILRVLVNFSKYPLPNPKKNRASRLLSLSRVETLSTSHYSIVKVGE